MERVPQSLEQPDPPSQYTENGTASNFDEPNVPILTLL
jgi:hypothetical protein